MTPPTLVGTATPEAPGPHRHAGPFARAAEAVPPPALVLVSVVSIQFGAAVAVHLIEVLGPISTTFLRSGSGWGSMGGRRLGAVWRGCCGGVSLRCEGGAGAGVGWLGIGWRGSCGCCLGAWLVGGWGGGGGGG